MPVVGLEIAVRCSSWSARTCGRERFWFGVPFGDPAKVRPHPAHMCEALVLQGPGPCQCGSLGWSGLRMGHGFSASGSKDKGWGPDSGFLSAFPVSHSF